MAGPQMIISTEKAREHLRTGSRMGWGAVKALALLFVCIGAADIGLAFYAPHFDDKGWLFGVLGGVIGGLPVLSLGLSGGLIAALSLRSRGWTLLLGVLNAVLALLIVGALYFFAGTLEEARRAAPVGMQMAIARTTIRTFLVGGLFSLLHIAAAVLSVRGFLSASPNT